MCVCVWGGWLGGRAGEVEEKGARGSGDEEGAGRRVTKRALGRGGRAAPGAQDSPREDTL